MKKILLVALPILIAFTSCKDKKNAESFINISDIEKDIQVLSADSLQGRSPLTIGETKSISYLEKRMMELGLEPAFDGSYFQEVPLVELTSHLPADLLINTPKGSIAFKAGKDFTATCPILKKDVSLNSSDLIFAGFGISAPDKGWNDFEGIDIKGKTIIVLVNDPDFYTDDTTLFKGKAMTYQGRWRYKFEEAERQGAAGCIIVHEEKAAGYPWSVTSLRTNKSDFSIDDEKLINPKCILTGWITYYAAIELFALCNLDYEEMKLKATRIDFKAIPMNATLSIKVENSWVKSFSNNVAGYIKGTERPDEVVVYCAHWDHLGVGQKANGDSIYNGASDNAAAIASMFSIAKAFKASETPKRSVLFFSPTAEEAGMLGSTYYVDHSPFDIKKTVACINNDVILFLGKFKDVTITGFGHSELDNYLQEEAIKQDRYICSDPNPENGMFFRSDQLPFLKAGVPSIFAKGYSHQVDLGKEKTQLKIDEYWKTIYHKPSDEYNPERDNLEGLVEDSKLLFNVGNRLVNESHFPTWNKDSEFYIKK
ncbi:MAG: M28 family peptidase [Tenuifilaceae bacterium]